MGLDVFLFKGDIVEPDNDEDYPEIEYIEYESPLHGEHLFNVGYFRSSYNSGGINNVARRYGLPGLYDIFGHENEYRFRPDWEQALVNCRDAIEQWKKFAASSEARFDVTDVSQNFLRPDHGPKSQEEAMSLFSEKYLDRLENARKNPGPYDGTGFSCIDGHFYNNPIQVRAAIPGFDVIGSPCVYLITESANTSDFDFYITGLKIVEETILHVLTRPDKGEYALSWSS